MKKIFHPLRDSFILLLTLTLLSSYASVTIAKGVLTGKWESIALSNPYPNESTLLYQFYENGRLEISFIRPDKSPKVLVGSYHIENTNVLMTFPKKGKRIFSYVIDEDTVTLTDLTNKNWVKCKRTK